MKHMDNLVKAAFFGTLTMGIALAAVAILGTQFEFTDGQVTTMSMITMAAIVGIVLLFGREEGTQQSANPFEIPRMRMPRLILGLQITLNISTNHSNVHRVAWAI